MRLRLDNAFFNPGIKGWVPADKSALISKGAQHLLFKRCVVPYPTLLNRRFSDLLCLDSMGVIPDVVHSHTSEQQLAVQVACTAWQLGGIFAVLVKNRANGLEMGWADGSSSAVHRVWCLPVVAEIRGVRLGRAGRAPHELVKYDGV